MADAITIKALQDASLDAKSLEEVVNGDEAKQVTTRKGETYPSVKKAITQMFQNGGLPATPFKTKALMTASALVDGKYAMVTDDANLANNGLYLKEMGVWDYSKSNKNTPVTGFSKVAGTKVTYDYSTKTLSWSGRLIVASPNFSGSRLIVEAGSAVFDSSAYQVAYIDTTMIGSDGIAKADAIKVAKYSTGFINSDKQIAIYLYNNNIDGEHYSLNGFPRAYGINNTQAYNDLADDDVIVNVVNPKLIKIYLKSSRRLSNRYIRYDLVRDTNLVIDASNAFSRGNVDMWRIDGAYETEKNQNELSPSEIRTILTGGEISCAAKINGLADSVGGYHGDEHLSNFTFLVDNVSISADTTKTYVCKKFELLINSNIFANNQNINPILDHKQHFIFKNRELRLKQHLNVLRNVTFRTLMCPMLPIIRTGVTKTATRSPDYTVENVATADFPVSVTENYPEFAKIWGDTGIGAEIEIMDYKATNQACFYIANTSNYNKFYYSLTGDFYQPSQTYAATTADKWFVDCVIRINTSI